MILLRNDEDESNEQDAAVPHSSTPRSRRSLSMRSYARCHRPEVLFSAVAYKLLPHQPGKHAWEQRQF